MRYLGERIRVFLLGLVLTAAAHSGVAEETVDKVLMSDEARVSYSLGQKMGTTIKKQRLDVELDPFMRGIRDVLMGAESLLTEEEMQEIRQTYWKQRQEKMAKEHKELAEKNLKAGKEFLAENGKKEGVVVLPSGLQYKVIESGDGIQPGLKDRVSMHYRGSLIDGTEIGTSYGREIPFSFRLQSAVPGQVEALQLMREGDKWQLFIPTELAYGERGRKGLVGPNETLIFEVELLTVQKAEAKPGVVPTKSGDEETETETKTETKAE